MCGSGSGMAKSILLLVVSMLIVHVILSFFSLWALIFIAVLIVIFWRPLRILFSRLRTGNNISGNIRQEKRKISFDE